MAEQSGFFNSHLSNGAYDRVYLAEHFAKYFASFIGNGVFGGKLNELMVSQSSQTGMKVEVLSGMAWINGFWYENTSNLLLEVDVADGVLNRIDNIVVKYGVLERRIWIEVVRGTPATVAVAPKVTRDSDYFELKLAEIYIKAGATEIIQANITDVRLDSTVCGLVTGVIKQPDVTELGKQLNSYIVQYAAEYRAWLDDFFANSDATFEDYDNECRVWLNKFYADSIKEFEQLKKSLDDIVADNDLVELTRRVGAVEGEAALASQTLGYSKKNLIPYPYNDTPGKTLEYNGITWIDNGDGTIIANGTATENSYYNLYVGEFPEWLKPGEYLITAGSSHTEHCYILFNKNKKGTNEYTGRITSLNNVEIVITEQDIEEYDITLAAIVAGGATVSNVTLKPMLRKAKISDDTWEPYKLSVAEIIQEDEATKGCFYRINRAGIKEWINPPSRPGIEYCTTERWDNKPVYQKTFYLSVLPDKNVAVLQTATQWDKVVSISGYAVDSDNLTYYPFPVILHGQITPIAVINQIEDDGSLALTTTIDASHLKAYVTVRYTK